MDENCSPQFSTSEVKDIGYKDIEDSDEASEELEVEEVAGPEVNSPVNSPVNTPSPKPLPVKPKIKRHKRPPDPSDPVVIAAQAAAASGKHKKADRKP